MNKTGVELCKAGKKKALNREKKQGKKSNAKKKKQRIHKKVKMRTQLDDDKVSFGVGIGARSLCPIQYRVEVVIHNHEP